MTNSLRSFFLLLGTLSSTAALAQTPTLEFAPSATGTTNPSGSGSTVADQVITFQNNANNPSDNAMATYVPTTKTTFSLSNQQYSQATTKLSTGTGVAFGATVNGSGGAAATNALFPLLNTIGGSAAGNYTSASGVTGGIDIAANTGTEVFTSVEPLPATVPANARYYYADLTVTFSQALVNPVLHLTGLGGASNSFGFATELDLQTSGPTLSKLSGSTELNVTSTKILNSAVTPAGATGSGAASGSVLVTTGTAGVTSLVFKLYLRPDAKGGTIHGTGTTHAGDAWLISVSKATASTAKTAPLPVQLATFTAQAAPGSRDAQLAWTTASELSNAYFDVERSLDGSTFSKVGQVAGQGSKTTATTYGFTDAGIGQQATGAVYYRLRQVDTDGSAAYSPVRIASFGAAGAAQVTLYPNPAQASTTLDLSSLPVAATYQVRVLDGLGRQLLAQSAAGSQGLPLDVSGLAPGLFTVLVTGTQADGTAFRQALRLHKN